MKELTLTRDSTDKEALKAARDGAGAGSTTCNCMKHASARCSTGTTFRIVPLARPRSKPSPYQLCALRVG